MSRVKMFFVMSLAVFFVSTVSGTALAVANGEDLLLLGIVSSVNSRSKHVVVDLQNKGCRGTKTFAVMKSDIAKLAPGNKIEFFINSQSCPGHEIRRITRLWGVE